MNIIKAAVNGILQNFSFRFFTFIVNFLTTLILVRFVSPEHFGLYAILQTFFSFVTLSASNIGQAAIYYQNIKHIFDYGYSLNIFISIVIFISSQLFFFILDKYFNLFFDFKVFNILLISSIIMYICDFRLSYLESNLNFLKSSLFFFISSLVASFSASLLAFYKIGIYALVLRDLILSLSLFFVLFFFNEHKFKFYINLKIFKKLFIFSYKMSLTEFLNLVTLKLPILYLAFLGKLNIVGNYEKSKYVSDLPKVFIEPIFGQISLPILTKLNIKKKIKYIYEILIFLIGFFSFIPVLLFSFSDLLVDLILGPQWYNSYYIIQSLSIYCYFSILKVPITYYLISINKLNKLIQINFYNFLITLLMILINLIFYKNSFHYIGYIVSINSIIFFIYFLFILKNLIYVRNIIYHIVLFNSISLIIFILFSYSNLSDIINLIMSIFFYTFIFLLIYKIKIFNLYKSYIKKI